LSKLPLVPPFSKGRISEHQPKTHQRGRLSDIGILQSTDTKARRIELRNILRDELSSNNWDNVSTAQRRVVSDPIPRRRYPSSTTSDTCDDDATTEVGFSQSDANDEIKMKQNEHHYSKKQPANPSPAPSTTTGDEGIETAPDVSLLLPL
jgi:hypothetical protein